MTAASFVRSIAITSYFAHHASFNGYRQILSHTKPDAIFGVDERNPDRSDYWGDRYPWTHELRAWRWHRRNPTDVVHILYGEWYLYASPWLFGRTPVVATFHQPADQLNSLLRHGPQTGRVMSLAHTITRNRHSRLSAAIVLTQDQKDVLSAMMPADRIHVIPLGTAAHHLIRVFTAARVVRQPDLILTVGEWLRDWNCYFPFVRQCRDAAPHLRFVLINRKLPAQWHAEARSLGNLTWRENAPDEELLQCYSAAAALFLPLREATGNNAVNEAMAAGLPIVTTIPLQTPAPSGFVNVVPPDHHHMLSVILRVCDLPESQRQEMRNSTRTLLASRDWAQTAQHTMDVYSRVARDSRHRKPA